MIGSLPEPILNAVLETLPIEFSIIDANDHVLAWNKHETRIFKRPEAVIGRLVQQCHPQKSVEKVEQILKEMKEGTRDKAQFWIDLPIGPDDKLQKVFISYHALRDANGTYLGCLEASQNISSFKSLVGQKRLLD